MRLSLLLISLLFISGPVTAQDSNVEINLDALQKYTPPPMFVEPDSTDEPEIEYLTPLPPSEVITPKKIVTVPLPAKKPAFHGTMRAQSLDIEEHQVIVQNAQDVLRQIEGSPPNAAPDVKKTANPPEQLAVKDRSSLTHGDHFEVTLPFPPAETALSAEHIQITLRQILIRLQKYEDARLEVIAYASSPEAQESFARRTSLKRALAIQDLLASKGINPRQIYLRPLGRAKSESKDYVQLRVSRL